MEKLIDISKAEMLVNCLNNMTNEEVHYTFTQLGYDGLINLNILMAHAFQDILIHAKEQYEKDKQKCN